MRLLRPDKTDACIPFRIVDREGAPGAGLGGRPPIGVVPASGSVEVRYFATIPFCAEPALCVSIFNPELEALMDARGVVNHGSGLLELVVHAVAARSQEPSPFDSALSEHSLVFLELVDDWIEGDDGQRIVRPEHKIGGTPHLVRETPRLVDALSNVERQGYSLIAQFDFPSGEDALVSGDWPFADGMFALLGRHSPSGWDWCWYWDY